MRPDADLSLLAQARLIGELLQALDLKDVTLVQNDWGGAQILIADGDTERVARLVITSSEAFDNYPPTVARAIVPVAKMPGGLAVFMWLLRFRLVARSPTR